MILYSKQEGLILEIELQHIFVIALKFPKLVRLDVFRGRSELRYPRIRESFN